MDIIKYTLPEKMTYLDSKSLLKLIEAYTYHICSDNVNIENFYFKENYCTMVLSNGIEFSSKNGSPVGYTYITTDNKIIQNSCYKQLLKEITNYNTCADIV